MVKRRREAGQTLALVAFCMVTFLAAAGLAVDMGYMRYEKGLMQSAADSAALVAATDANLGESGSATADAQAVAIANGFQDGVNNTVVSVINPPNPPVNLGNAYQVTIQQVLPTFFMKVVGINSSTVSASGVATIATSPGCIYALQAGGAGLTVNAGINAPNCGIVDNGSLNGVGDIGAASLGVYVPGGYGGVATLAPVETIAQPAADPLAYLTPPGPGSCPIPSPTVVNATSGPLMNGVETLGPGTYCGIIISSGGIVTFNPGLYILDNGTGLLIQGTGTATGTGVSFYIDPSGGAITFSGTGAVTLSAPTSAGTLPANILFYQDSGNASAADVSEAGSGNVTLSGTLYFPNAPLTIGGSLNPNQNSLVVAQSVTVSGTVQLNVDSTSPALAPGGSPLENVSLVE
jgi:Putative Flp pilus-assembly TadE/G-like